MKRFASVIFDCDSTLSSVEGIEELAGDRRAEVVALTDAAMRGGVPLEEVYGRRLEIARPSRDQVEALGRRYVETLVDDAADVVRALLDERVDVRIISGGLLPAVRILARALGVTDDRVAAVDVAFDANGRFAGFDRSSPLARAGGKLEVIRAWAPPRPSLLVGDGATDLEAASGVDRFVAFAGVAERPAVVAAADHAIRAPSLAPVLPIVLDSPPRDGTARAAYHKGMQLLGPQRPWSRK